MKKGAFVFLYTLVLSLTGGIAKAIEVKVLRDLPYAGTANPRQTLDLAIPKESTSEKTVALSSFGYMAEGGKTGTSEAVIGLIACEPSCKPEDMPALRSHTA